MGREVQSGNILVEGGESFTKVCNQHYSHCILSMEHFIFEIYLGLTKEFQHLDKKLQLNRPFLQGTTKVYQCFLQRWNNSNTFNQHKKYRIK